MARLVRQPDLSPFIDVLLVLIIWWTIYGVYRWDRLRDTLTIVAVAPRPFSMRAAL